MKITREPFSPQPRKFYDEQGQAYYAYPSPTPLCAGQGDVNVLAYLDQLAAARDREENPALAAVLDAADREANQDLYRAALDRHFISLGDAEVDTLLVERQRAVARAWNRRIVEPVLADYIYPEGPGFREGPE